MYDFKDLVMLAKNLSIFGSEAFEVEAPDDVTNRNVLLRSG